MADIIRRPDLEAQAVSLPGYLVDTILPYLSKPQIAGNLYYQKWFDDFTAQTGRDTANIGSITRTNIMKANALSFNCAEVRERVPMSYTERKGYATDATADLAMGRMAKRSFYNNLELKCAKLLLDVASPISAISDPVTAIDTQVTLLRDKGIGEIALVLSNHNFVALKKNATVIDRMKMTGVGAYGLDPRYITADQMAAIFGVDKVLIGKDAIWFGGLDAIDRGNIALCVIPDGSIEPNEEIQLGRTIYFDWGSESEHFVMESWHDCEHDCEVVDAKGLVDMKVFNADLMATIQIFDAQESSSAETSES